jgi:hypothetical protein
MTTRRGVLAVLGAMATSSAAASDKASPVVEPAAGRALADRLVAAMGGAEAWSRAKGLTIAGAHFESDLPGPYDNVLAIDLETPRMRFEGRSAWGMARVRAVVGDKGWRVSEIRPLGPMTAEQVAGDIEWWTAHPYRNVRRLAVGDPGVTPRVGAGGRLDLIRPDGSTLMWYRLNTLGEPYAFGVGSGEAWTVLGPLNDVPGGVRLPLWATRMDGTFRGSGLKGAVTPHPPQVDYEKP